jgi:hypothetical protein
VNERLIAWCGFLGSWLLVAGPIFQASLELRAEAFERDHLDAVKAGVEKPRPVSAWWWFLPPVKYVLERRRGRAYRDQVIAQLPAADIEALVRYLNKAMGWLYVGLGGFLIAVTETWHLREVYEWPQVAFWIVVVVMAAGCALNTAVRQKRSERIRH